MIILALPDCVKIACHFFEKRIDRHNILWYHTRNNKSLSGSSEAGKVDQKNASAVSTVQF